MASHSTSFGRLPLLSATIAVNARAGHKSRSLRKFLVGGLLGGTVLVVIFSAAFHDWVYLARWMTGALVVGMVAARELGKNWLLRVAAPGVRRRTTQAHAACLTSAPVDLPI